MFLVILGIIAILVGIVLRVIRGSTLEESKSTQIGAGRKEDLLATASVLGKAQIGASVGGWITIVIGILIAGIVIIPAGHRGVLLQFSKVQGTLQEGIHIVIPVVQSVRKMTVQTQKEELKAPAGSRDMQKVTTKIALNFHLDPSNIGELYRNVGEDYKTKIIDPAIQESVKMITAKYTAEQLITRRHDVKVEITAEIEKRLSAYNILLDPNGMSITDFDFSEEFNNAIEKKQVAQQEAEQQKYLLQKAELERQTVVAQAKGEAESSRLRAIALQTGGGSKVLAREWIAKWDGHLPQVAGGGGYIIDVKSLMAGKTGEEK